MATLSPWPVRGLGLAKSQEGGHHLRGFLLPAVHLTWAQKGKASQPGLRVHPGDWAQGGSCSRVSQPGPKPKPGVMTGTAAPPEAGVWMLSAPGMALAFSVTLLGEGRLLVLLP